MTTASLHHLILAASVLCVAFADSHALSGSGGKVLVVGATGTTGLRAIQGLLDVGYEPAQLVLTTRDSSKPKIRKLRKIGFGIVEADLQRVSSLRGIGKGCAGCYVHATGGDTAELDTSEVSSARNLADALHDDVKSVVYNSAAGAVDHGVARIQQKHDVEAIFAGRERPCRVTSLRANIFGEELWKEYTRPRILSGEYPLPVNRWRKIYLTSVRDMGRLAGTIIAKDTGDGGDSGTTATTTLRVINVAGGHMSGPRIARAFGRAQGSECRHVNNRELTKMAKESFPDLYEQIHFLQTSKERTNIRALKRQFPGLISSFDEFLEESQWGDPERTFEDLSNPESLVV